MIHHSINHHFLCFFFSIFLKLFYHWLQTNNDWLQIIIFLNAHTHTNPFAAFVPKNLIAQISFGRWYVFALKQTEMRKFSLLRCEYGEKFTITKAERKRTVIHSLARVRARGEQKVCAYLWECVTKKLLSKWERPPLEECGRLSRREHSEKKALAVVIWLWYILVSSYGVSCVCGWR